MNVCPPEYDEARILRTALENVLRACVNSRGEITGNLTREQMYWVEKAALALLQGKSNETAPCYAALPLRL